MKTVRRLVVAGGAALLLSGVPATTFLAQEEVRSRSMEPGLQAPAERARSGTVAKGQRASDALDKGPTFHALEQAASRVTTTFQDAVTVSERAGAGEIVTEVRDRSGNPRATLKARGRTLDFSEGGQPSIRVQAPDGLVPTLDWAGRQAYLLVRDRAAERRGAAVVEGNVVRPRGRPSLRGELEERIVSVVTEWPDGLTATAQWRASGNAFTPSETPTGSFTTFLHANGVEVGWVRWIAEPRIALWSFADSTGWINDEHLKEYGGWPFVPDMAWANVQAFAWHHLPSRRIATQRASGSLLASLQAFLAPTVSAQNPPNGCTLPLGGVGAYLDGTVLRVCCDAHDLCYWAYGCSQRSWYWPFGNAWQCTACNLGVVHCFAYGGEFPYPYSQLP